ncbi:MAG: carbohydrate-binding protein [Paludibacteraceae bacterium]|nr:carbohydrate-binding protein [Paludibacteraceae bacterium]
MKRIIANAIFAGLALNTVAQTCTVNLSEVHQKIQGFGGINHPCWTGYDLTNNDIDKLFGVGEGKLGLSVMRIWVAESESNWSREVSTCKKVQNMGVKIFATPWNTPSADMCTKTTAFCGNNSCQYRANEKQINTSAFEKYTQHLINFNNYMKNQGVSLYAMSYANEPDYGHDWTWWTSDQVYDYAKNYAGRLRINGTKVITAESFAYSKGLYDKILNDNNALKNIDILGTHFYASGASTSDNFFKYTLGDQKIASNPDKELWMTEYYTSSESTGGSPCRANVWPEALEVAYSIHRGMAISNMSAYVWWYLKRNYSLINNGDSNNENSKDGQITKRGWLFGQYARFIRPGFYRVGCTINPTYNVYTSAYKKDNDVVVVAVNMSTEAKTITISVPGTKVQTWNVYITDQTRNMAKLSDVKGSSFQVTLPAKSCVSYVGTATAKVSIDLEAESLTVEEGDSIKITPNCKSEDGEIKNVKYFEGSTQIKDKWVAPFELFFGRTASIGSHVIKAVAYDSNGESAETSITINVVKKRKPFNGTAQVIPGIIEAENFDDGAAGSAYYEVGEEQKGDAAYRSEDVDIYKCKSGYAIGYTEKGEWLKYTVEVEEDGDYDLYASLAAGGDGSAMTVTFDNDKENAISFTAQNTGDWDTYAEVEAPKSLHLTAGKHEITIDITASWVNIDYLKFVKANFTGLIETAAEAIRGEYYIYDAKGRFLDYVTVKSEDDLDRLNKGVFILKGKDKTFKVVR